MSRKVLDWTVREALLSLDHKMDCYATTIKITYEGTDETLRNEDRPTGGK